MGAKTSMLLRAAGDVRSVLQARPALDHAASRALVERLYPGRRLTTIEDGTLLESSWPESGAVYAASVAGLDIVCSRELAGDRPSLLDRRFLDGRRGTAILHAMHSAVDWFALGVWKDGVLVRALSVSPESGIVENIGEPLPFERPFWEGQRPAEADEETEAYPLPFHPLELAEHALRALCGFVLEEAPEPGDLDPEAIPLAGFRLKRSLLASLFGRG